MELLTWGTMATSAGALVMVVVITQLTKGVALISKIPTRLWSYLVALLVLFPAHYFTGQLALSDAVLIFFNAAIVALAANGGYEALSNLFPGLLSGKSTQ